MRERQARSNPDRQPGRAPDSQRRRRPWICGSRIAENGNLVRGKWEKIARNLASATARDAARLLGQLAARSGQVLNITPVAGAIGLERSTAENYVKLLEAVFLVHRLPAWGTTLGSRVVKHPKVHILDSGVMAWLLSLTPEKITQADPSTLTEYGHLLETFAVGEIPPPGIGSAPRATSSGISETGPGVSPSPTLLWPIQERATARNSV